VIAHWRLRDQDCMGERHEKVTETKGSFYIAGPTADTNNSGRTGQENAS